MIYITIIIPIITLFILFLKFKKETTYWEYALVGIPSIILIILLNTVMVHYRADDEQYHSQFVWNIKHYEPWNEYVHKTCSQSHSSGSGKNRRSWTTYYDCSYVRYHSDRWTISTQNMEVDVTEETYESLLKRFGTQTKKVDMNRHYHTIDGNMFQTDWNGERESFYSLDSDESYCNKTRAFHQLFHLEDIDDDEKIKWKLYDYPSITNLKQSTVLGYSDKNLQNKVDYLNTRFSNFPFRLYILFFNGSESVVKKQRSYWEGGNENELVLCVGLDSLTGTVNWSKTFSWSGDKYLEEELESKISMTEKFQGDSICSYLEKNIPIYWQPKKMKDYDYLEVEVSDSQLICIWIFLLIYNTLISYYIIKNDINNGI